MAIFGFLNQRTRHINSRKSVTLVSMFTKLFIIIYIIADESRDKRSQFLLELTILKTHLKHYLWLLTNYMLVLLKTLAPTKAIFTW